MKTKIQINCTKSYSVRYKGQVVGTTKDNRNLIFDNIVKMIQGVSISCSQGENNSQIWIKK
jgi:hypothetical protein